MKKAPRRRRRNLLPIAIIGYKQAFKKLLELIKHKIKGVFLKIQYKAAELSYKRELRKINKRNKN